MTTKTALRRGTRQDRLGNFATVVVCPPAEYFGLEEMSSNEGIFPGIATTKLYLM